MNHKPLSLFEKSQRRSGADTEARCAVDRKNVLYDGHGNPVLDKDGHPVYVDRELGRRPLLNGGETASLGSIPPAEERERTDSLGPIPPMDGKDREDDRAVILPAEPSVQEGDDPAGETDPLRLLLEEAVRPSDPD